MFYWTFWSFCIKAKREKARAPRPRRSAKKRKEVEEELEDPRGLEDTTGVEPPKAPKSVIMIKKVNNKKVSSW